MRLKKGREMRWKNYSQEIRKCTGSNHHSLLEKLENYWFTRDFEKLAEASDSHLDKKIAVVYFDGNDFTRIQREVLAEARHKKSKGQPQVATPKLVKEIEAQKKFDRRLKEYRACYLASLLDAILDSEGKPGSVLFANPTVRWTRSLANHPRSGSKPCSGAATRCFSWCPPGWAWIWCSISIRCREAGSSN